MDLDVPNPVFITTPCLNAIETIDRTIMSVAAQAGDFAIRYHVQDGASSDGTLDRLSWWSRRLTAPDFPIQCHGLEFSFASEPDTGMYDAIIKGFSKMKIGADDFMTWINADDIMMQGALAFVSNVQQQFSPQEVSWFGGAASIIREDVIAASFDRPVPTSALRAGLCDGTHWDFLQQEGTFFRKWLWDDAKPEETIRPMKLAGDWNLWRLFAQKAYFVQCKLPLGGFRLQEGQLSARQRDRYFAEMDSLLSASERRASLSSLVSHGSVKRRSFTVNYYDGSMAVVNEDKERQLAHHYEKIFNKSAGIVFGVPHKEILFQGEKRQPHSQSEKPSHITFENNVLAFDRDWQFPAITEKHALSQIRQTSFVCNSIVYVAYPWATLIDKIQSKAPDAEEYLAQFRDFQEHIPQSAIKVTVCQHILMRKYIHLFEECGINDIFWSHATHEDLDRDAVPCGPAIHAFPLYPVQLPAVQSESLERPYLFSFIGAKSNKWYLTRARDWIIDILADDPRGQVIGRHSWHYQWVVYDWQIKVNTKSVKADAENQLDQSAAEEFKASLVKSVFSLCPSGSGPNSIRLWESIGAGAIPVILADTYAPPGDPKLWEAAAVFCEETPEAVKALPDRLEEIAREPERLEAMRHAAQQVWMLYGPQSFVYDIRKLMLATGSNDRPETIAHLPQATAMPTLLDRFSDLPEIPEQQAVSFLRVLAGALILKRVGPCDISGDTLIGRLLERSKKALSFDHPTVQHIEKVVTYIHPQMTEAALSSPGITSGGLPKICLMGRHGNRTPLSYQPFQRLADARVEQVSALDQADVIMTGFNIDLKENAEALEQLIKRRPQTRIVVISEEPLWDSTWSGGFLERTRVMQHEGIELPYTFLNHHNSGIFDFRKMPYFLLTNDDFLPRYTALLARHADWDASDLLEHWRDCPISAAFFAEARDGESYNKAFDAHEVFGLSAYRTMIARQVSGPSVVRAGKGWNTFAARQMLPDWHLDKLATLDKKARIVSAYENTHQNRYVSEKIFDAFAVGAIPTYYAGAQHRIFDLVPDRVMINTFDQTAEQATHSIFSFEPDLDYAKAWIATVSDLSRRFGDVNSAISERRRIVDEIVGEIDALF